MLTEVGHTGDSSQTYAWGVRPETTWTATVTFDQCDVGSACGSLDLSTADYAGTGQPQTCSLALTLRSHVGEPLWPAFTETAADEATTCEVGWLDAGVIPADASESADR